MEKVVVQCACGKKYSLALELRGKKVKCAACGAVLKVPDAPRAQLDDLVPLPDGPLDNPLGSLLDESFAAPQPAPLPAFSAAPLRRARDPAEQEREDIDAELADLKEQMKEEFQIGHTILKARGRLNAQIERERENAPSSGPLPGLQTAAFLTGIISGIGGFWVGMLFAAFWPNRTTRSNVTYGAVESAGLDAAATYARRRRVSAEARSEALETLIGKRTRLTDRLTARWGSTLCGAAVAAALVLMTFLLSLITPLFGIVFFPIAIFFGFRVRSALTALDQAVLDYPHTAVRLGGRWTNLPLTALGTLAVMVLSLACVTWIGYSTYRWGSNLAEHWNDEPEKQGEGVAAAQPPAASPNAPVAPAKTAEPPLLPDTEWGKYVRMPQTTWQIAVPHAQKWLPYGGVPNKLRPGTLKERTSSNQLKLEGMKNDVYLNITETVLSDAGRQQAEQLLESELQNSFLKFEVRKGNGPRRLDERFAPAIAVDELRESPYTPTMWVMVVVTPDGSRTYAVVAHWVKDREMPDNLDSLSRIMASFRIDPPVTLAEQKE